MSADATLAHALEDALAELDGSGGGLPPARDAGSRAARLLRAVAARHAALVAGVVRLDAEARREIRRRAVAERALAIVREGPAPRTEEEAQAMAAEMERVARAIARDRAATA